MTAHPQFKHTTVLVSLALLFSIGFASQFARRTCAESGFGMECFIGWTSVLSCTILFVLLAMLALYPGEPVENITRFWKSKAGKPILVPLSILIPVQITWHMWGLTVLKYERGEHDFLMLIYGYLAVVSSLWIAIMAIALSYRLITRRRTSHAS